MSVRPTFPQFTAYLDAQSRAAAEAARGKRPRPPFVTLSRQMGTGAVHLGKDLADDLQARDRSSDVPWTVLDRDLMDRVLQEHHLPTSLAPYLPEGRISEIQAAIRELFGLHPPLATMMRQMAETVLGLAEMGRVILVGRGAHRITAHLEGGVHVRLVGSFEKRVERVMALHRLSRKAAAALIKKCDAGRRAFVKKFHGVDVADPLLYHLVINTDRVPIPEAARLIGDLVLSRVAHA
ncbi:MAG: cytidylate kinase-like family protein [Verrucomicrobiae bacterium]|nr:cytidylate kinase-like family protein [Verrucomicrobiae bacterium]